MVGRQIEHRPHFRLVLAYLLFITGMGFVDRLEAPEFDGQVRFNGQLSATKGTSSSPLVALLDSHTDGQGAIPPLNSVSTPLLLPLPSTDFPVARMTALMDPPPLYETVDGPMPPAVTLQLHEAFAEVLTASIPPSYENDRNWGETKKVYAGIKLRSEGLKLETERRWKEVNHGSWQKYRIDLVDPKERLQIQAAPLVRRPDGKYTFDVTLVAAVKLFGRWSRWNYGVQMISLSGNADATLRLRLTGTVGFQWESSGFVPDLVINPHFDTAEIALLEFRLHDISDVGGEFAQQAGKGLREVLEKDFIPKQADRLPEKLNRKVEQKRDRLRISPDDWLTRWLRREGT